MVRVNGLGHVDLEAALQRAAAVFRLDERREGDGGQGLGRITPLADFPQQFKSIATGQPQVADEHVRLKLVELSQRLLDIDYIANFSVTFREDAPGEFARIWIVFDNQDARSREVGQAL